MEVQSCLSCGEKAYREDGRVPRSQQTISRPGLKALRTTACPGHPSPGTFPLEWKLPQSQGEQMPARTFCPCTQTRTWGWRLESRV